MGRLQTQWDSFLFTHAKNCSSLFLCVSSLLFLSFLAFTEAARITDIERLRFLLWTWEHQYHSSHQQIQKQTDADESVALCFHHNRSSLLIHGLARRALNHAELLFSGARVYVSVDALGPASRRARHTQSRWVPSSTWTPTDGPSQAHATLAGATVLALRSLCCCVTTRRLPFKTSPTAKGGAKIEMYSSFEKVFALSNSNEEDELST